MKPRSRKAVPPLEINENDSLPHQLGQSVFKVILPEDIAWMPFAAFPPSVALAILVGQPSAKGPYTIRVKVPGGLKLMPHRHVEDRTYTVISGVFYVGLGDRFDPTKLEAYPPGAVIVLPGGTPHFHWARSGEYVTQVTAIGPLGIEYVDPRHDPRTAGSAQRSADGSRHPVRSSACDTTTAQTRPAVRFKAMTKKIKATTTDPPTSHVTMQARPRDVKAVILAAAETGK